jgi:beta-N-acetylhexosaminidase
MGEVIRDRIGLKGLVMSDDIGMQALGGPMAERAQAVIAAGCDVALHCSGDLAEMRQIAERVPPLAGQSAARFAKARAQLREPEAFDAAASIALVTEIGGTAIASA